MFEPFWARESAMGEQAMVSNGNSELSESDYRRDADHNCGPAEEPWYKCKQGSSMIAGTQNCTGPTDLAGIYRARQRQAAPGAWLAANVRRQIP